jgi:hypothetical protein
MEMRWRYIMAYLVLIVSYATVTLAAPVKGNTFDLDRLTLGLLQLTFILPIVGIWIAGATGASNLRKYVRESADERSKVPLRSIANGVLLLVTGLVVTTLLGSIRSYAIGHDWFSAYRILVNYLSVGFLVGGMALLYRGTSSLEGITRSRKRRWFIGGAMLGLLAILTILMSHNPYRNSTPDPVRYQSYFLSDPLIFLTILLPQALAWYYGILAGLRVRAYARTFQDQRCVRGYTLLGDGVLAIITVSILLVALTLVTGALTNLSLGPLLGIIYLILLFYGLGYVLIALGARKLYRPRASAQG